MRRGIARAQWLDLHKLRVFAAVAEHEHYSRAAAALGISQPALSVHVRDLERYWGVTLFEREGRNVRLTDTGRLVQNYARRILALAVELDQEIDDLRGLHSGQLSLGASTTIGAYLLPATLGIFQKRYPGIGVAVDIANTARIVDRIFHGELHLGLIGEPLHIPGLIFESYREDELVLIVSQSHPWANQIITIEKLAAMPLVMRETGSATHAVAETALAAAGVRPSIALELGSTEAVKGAIVAGLGASFISTCAVERELTTNIFSRVTVAGLTIKRQFQVVRRRDRTLTAAELAFLALLRQ